MPDLILTMYLSSWSVRRKCLHLGDLGDFLCVVPIRQRDFILLPFRSRPGYADFYKGLIDLTDISEARVFKDGSFAAWIEGRFHICPGEWSAILSICLLESLGTCTSVSEISRLRGSLTR